MTRPTWDNYFIEIAKLVSSRATCLRRKVGAIIVKDKRILSTGYNGAPTGLAHCSEVGCLREKLHISSGERHELCRGVHAEQNAIIQAARFGVSIDNATLYLTDSPCIICSREIINAGIKVVVYGQGYPDTMARKFLKEAKIKVLKYKAPPQSSK
ncbi:MAG: cytidine/deoxycytidylate deaminase family protein [Candidatus Stahlbacteria bacterium]|nr:cytidine/deoxycytidylate deaminase family protein [Candidatus Stahlbacteria bacterium]